LTVGFFQTEHLTNDAQWKGTDAMIEISD